jgi:hypothetical protein
MNILILILIPFTWE